jgi:hypothetical protein
VVVEASRQAGGTVALFLTEAGAVVLHEAIASAEFADDLDNVALGEPVEKKVFSDVQQALAPLVPDLGTDRYGVTVQGTYASIDPSPY